MIKSEKTPTQAPRSRSHLRRLRRHSHRQTLLNFRVKFELSQVRMSQMAVFGRNESLENAFRYRRLSHPAPQRSVGV